MEKISSGMAQFDEEYYIDMMDMSDNEGWYDFEFRDGACSSKPSRGEIGKKLYQKLERKYTQLPIENVIKESVLPFLPAKVLTRFRSVSTQWDSWIQSRILSHRQSYSFLGTSGFFYQNYGANPTFLSLNPSAYGVPNPSLDFLPGKVNIIASSHGLITCLSQVGYNTYYVCNPANQTWRQLPKPEFNHGSNSAHALVFEPNLNNIEGKYQLVCAFSLLNQPVIFFEIYSSETNSWRCSSAMCVDFGYAELGSPGFHMKGMAYWVMSGKQQVLAFDLKNNVYEVIQLPTESLPCGALAQVHNELCYANISYTCSNNYVVKLYQGMDLKLKQEIELLEPVTADEQRNCRILPCFEEDRLMILSGGVMYSYEVGGSIEVVRREMGYTARAAVGGKLVPYVNSLVHVV